MTTPGTSLLWGVFLTVQAAFVVMAVVLAVGGQWLGLSLIPIGFMVACLMAGMTLPPIGRKRT